MEYIHNHLTSSQEINGKCRLKVDKALVWGALQLTSVLVLILELIFHETFSTFYDWGKLKVSLKALGLLESGRNTNGNVTSIS